MAPSCSVRASLMATFLILVASTALAQSGIAGVVKDTTGAVLPGVTVEASSPALIEQVRTVVTDGQGQYKIVSLRPGVYTVTFTLTGFATVKREGVELTTDFTPTVNAELRVGALQETVTVSGQGGVVDVQNVVQQRVITTAVVDAIPSARTYQNLAALVPGMTLVGVGVRPSPQDVGGSVGEASVSLAIHGGKTADMSMEIDGFAFSNAGNRSSTGFSPVPGATEEYSYELGAISAETATGGVRVNLIPKDGGSVFKGTLFSAYTNHNLQSGNFTDELQARGLGTINAIDKIWEVNPSFGGPIKKDRLWFFGSFRYWGDQQTVANMFYSKDPKAFVYTPDLSRPALDDTWFQKESFRLTWQVNQKNKLSLYGDHEDRCICHRGVSANQTPEASFQQTLPVNNMFQATWSSPVTNRLLFEAGVSNYALYISWPPAEPQATPDTVSVVELSTNLRYRAFGPMYSHSFNLHQNYRAAMSYVTGSHAFKVGVKLVRARVDSRPTVNGDMNFQFFNGIPRSITVYATPLNTTATLNADLGIFAQDQWTIKRLTLNLGVRSDYFNASIPEQHLSAGQFVPARNFAAVPDVPNWTDVSPRVGASYDLFGNGKTALKMTLSRYLLGDMTTFANNNNPVNTSVNNASRTWTDVNGDFIPQENELGPYSNANFGNPNITTRYANDVRAGFGSRGYNWESTAGVQHELRQGLAVNATYFRRWYGNLLATDNLAVTPAAYDPYCITAPVNAGLPGGGGNQLCGLYDINPAKFGQVNNLVSSASNFGKQWEHYNGVDLTLNARLPHGALVQGGLNTGRSETNNCFVVDSPQQLRYCDAKPPILTQVRLLGTIHLPRNIQVGATFQSLPGPEITASYVATNAQISPSLGRNLAAGANSTVIVDLTPPGTKYDTRLNQLDIRASRIVRIGRMRIQPNFDLYNLLNASPVLVVNTRYGSAWQQPTFILPGRLFKIGAQVDF